MSAPQEPGYVQKLRRAEQHFEELRALLDDFVHQNPCPVEEKFDPHSKQRRWWVSGDPPDPNIIWSPLFGEFFYNARSALDQVIWATVARFKPKGNPPSRLIYPIFKDALEFAFHMREPLKSLPSDVLTIIERSQPYNGIVGPDRDSLALLNQLGNIDKHKRPNLTIYSTNGYFTFGEFPHATARVWFGRVKKGTVLLELPARSQEEMDVGFTPRFGIAFAEGHADYVIAEQILMLITAKVARIVRELQPFT